MQESKKYKKRIVIVIVDVLKTREFKATYLFHEI